MSTEQPPSFGALLRQYRRAAGLTQEELAERAGLSRGAIDTLERGARRTPRKETLALLAEALALGPDERAALAASRRARAAVLATTPAADSIPAGRDGRDGQADAPTSALLPHGVVTFLFADLQGSTRLLLQLGSERYAALLAEVQGLLRTVWTAHAGHELGMQEDHLFVVFASADDALAAAAEAQRVLATHGWPDGVHLRVRMGVHTGAALLTAGRYVGLEVQRAVRIAAAGHGGQVVVSQAAVDQVNKFGQVLPEGTRLQDLGTHRLPGPGRRERLSQLELPGLQSDFPPLRTEDVWPQMRANLVLVAALTLALLTLAGLLLPMLVPSFPRVFGLVAGAAVIVLLAAGSVAVLLRQRGQARGAGGPPWLQALTGSLTLPWAWREGRKGVVAVVSILLSAVVIVTTLFVTKLPIFVGPAHAGYDFSYTYHAPTRTGGSVVIGTWYPLETLAPTAFIGQLREQYLGLWHGCVVQLPDTTLGFKVWKADQCTEVPTIANRGESLDGKTTIFRIDPHAVWSDGVSITADDFLFAFHLLVHDHEFNYWTAPHWSLMTLTKLDTRTVKIDWSTQYGDYLATLAQLTPLPLHVLAQGRFAGVYDQATGAYDAALGQQLQADASFNTAISVDNGPFTVRSFVPGNRLVLARNPHFFSKFFYGPWLDQVTVVSTFTCGEQCTNFTPSQNALIAAYRRGELTLADGLDAFTLGRLGGIPTDEVISSPQVVLYELAFNQRGTAPNARLNSGTPIFGDLTVRRAFVEAFDRCAAMRAALGIHDCSDPTFHTDEFSAPGAADYDPSVILPAFNPTDAAAQLNQAGYHVVNDIRRFKDGTTPFELTLAVTPSAQGAPSVARQLQQDYDRYLKIRVTIVNLPAADFQWYQAGKKGAYDISMFVRTDSPDPVGQMAGDWGWDSGSIPSAQNPEGRNWIGVIDPWVLTLDQRGYEAIDDGARAGVYAEMQHYLAQQFYLEPVFIDANVALVKPTLCNFKKWPTSALNTWNMADWYLARGPTCP